MIPIQSYKGRLFFKFALLCVCFVTGLLISGGFIFSDDDFKVRYYAKTMCHIIERVKASHSSSSNNHRTSTYKRIWLVYHNYDIRRYATIDGGGTKDHDQANGTYPCWYDTRRPSVAQWNKPTRLNGIILLSFGVFSTIITGMLFYFSYRFTVQDRHKMSQNQLMSVYTVDTTI